MKRFTACLALIAVATTSCSSFSAPRQTTFKTQEEAGTVQVAVQSVAPFEDYISTLEPKFNLKPEDALAQALAQTQAEDSQIVRQFMASLQLALPSITHMQSSAVTDDGTKTTTTSSNARSSKPGSLSDMPAAPAAVASPLGALALPANSNVDFDQSLKYRAATALAQEVSLLSHYVRDAAVQSGTKPYIVRMLVTVLPSARNEPYDAYSTISFFTKRDQPAQATSWAYSALVKGSHARKQETEDSCAAGKEHCYVAPEDVALLRYDTQPETRPACTLEPVRVIPLLVTDDLESSMHSSALQMLRDVGAALQGTLSNMGISAGARNHAEDLDKTLSRNLNSIFALGQPAPNAILARLGAAFSNGQYVTVARTYSVSLLLLAKTAEDQKIGAAGSEVIPCPAITFTATTQLHDANGQRFMPARSPEISSRELASLLRGRHLYDTTSLSAESAAATLLADAMAGDFPSFKSHLPSTTSDNLAAATWTDAIAVAQSSGRSSGDFAVSLPVTKLPGNHDFFTLFDDGKTTRLTINNASNILPDRLRAVIKTAWADDPKWVFLTNDSVEVGEYGRTATFSFPSIQKLRPAKAEAKDTTPAAKKAAKKRGTTRTEAPATAATDTKAPSGPKHVYAEVTYGSGIRSWQSAGRSEISLRWYPIEASATCNSNKTPVRAADADLCAARVAEMIDSNEIEISYLPIPAADAPKAKPGFTIAIPSRWILADTEGTGDLALEVRSTDSKDPKKVHFRIDEGGFIDTVTPDPVHDGAERIASDGIYRIKLRNLTPGSRVVVHAFRIEGKDEVAVPDEVAFILAAPRQQPKSEKEKEK